MRMGQDGFALVKPDQNGGLPVKPEITDSGVEENNGGGGGGGTTDGEEEPEQTDTDIYDEITEIKIS